MSTSYIKKEKANFILDWNKVTHDNCSRNCLRMKNSARSFKKTKANIIRKKKKKKRL